MQKVMSSKYLKNLLDHIETSCKDYLDAPPKVKSIEKTSSTWNHFTEPENGKVKCKKCDTEMSSKHLQNLTRHHNRCKKEGEAPNVEEGDNEATESDRD
uniref:BED-type domain-containing protein n=1 Tax=Meloidogyne enterolobii TaxID=390850 RepID=A0A6V7WH32_MELEN|nr:unnamed protein product [Meloidogyne enterolobii]